MFPGVRASPARVCVRVRVSVDDGVRVSPHGGHVASDGSPQEGRRRIIVHGRCVGACRQQALDDGGVPSGGGLVQRHVASEVLAVHRHTPVLDQELYHSLAACCQTRTHTHTRTHTEHTATTTRTPCIAVWPHTMKEPSQGTATRRGGAGDGVASNNTRGNAANTRPGAVHPPSTIGSPEQRRVAIRIDGGQLDARVAGECLYDVNVPTWRAVRGVACCVAQTKQDPRAYPQTSLTCEPNAPVLPPP